MLFTFVVMFLVLCVAGIVAVYVAYPHRGQEVPHAPWLGDVLKKGVEALPTLPAETDVEARRELEAAARR